MALKILYNLTQNNSNFTYLDLFALNISVRFVWQNIAFLLIFLAEIGFCVSRIDVETLEVGNLGTLVTGDIDFLGMEADTSVMNISKLGLSKSS